MLGRRAGPASAWNRCIGAIEQVRERAGPASVTAGSYRLAA